jgi:hypothetical protein
MPRIVVGVEGSREGRVERGVMAKGETGSADGFGERLDGRNFVGCCGWSALAGFESGCCTAVDCGGFPAGVEGDDDLGLFNEPGLK